MCELCAPAGGWSRRRFLGALAAVPVAAGIGVSGADAVGAGTLQVLPRSAWAGDAPPARPVAVEPDVRFLLVHHTVNVNDYAEAEVPTLLRNIHAFHTGPEKGWPDVAYNFIVDRFGSAWETRQGSLQGTVAGDATGGSQGFDQKCAFLGDHTSEPPSDAATATMTQLLAWLADRSGIDTRPGAVAQFTSRGSNRHPAGSAVETPTITGHRTMSYTACPGDAAFALVSQRLPADVSARRNAVAAPTTSTTSAPPTSSAPPTTTTTTTTGDTTGATAAPSTTVTDELRGPAAGAATPAGEPDPFPVSLPALGAIGAGAVVLGTVIARRARLG